MNKKERELLEKQFMDEMVTPKMRKLEVDDDQEWEDYVKSLDRAMWRGVFIASLVSWFGSWYPYCIKRDRWQRCGRRFRHVFPHQCCFNAIIWNVEGAFCHVAGKR